MRRKEGKRREQPSTNSDTCWVKIFCECMYVWIGERYLVIICSGGCGGGRCQCNEVSTRFKSVPIDEPEGAHTNVSNAKRTTKMKTQGGTHTRGTQSKETEEKYGLLFRQLTREGEKTPRECFACGVLFVEKGIQV